MLHPLRQWQSRRRVGSRNRRCPGWRTAGHRCANLIDFLAAPALHIAADCREERLELREQLDAVNSASELERLSGAAASALSAAVAPRITRQQAIIRVLVPWAAP